MNQALSGVANQKVDVDVEIEKALAQQELQNELEWLRAEVDKKDKKIKKQKKLLDKSGINMDGIKTVLQEGKGILGALGFGATSPLSGAPPHAESEVEIEIEGDGDESPSEEQGIYDDLVQNVGKKGIKKALRVMTLLSQHPELESTLTEILNQKTDKNGEA